MKRFQISQAEYETIKAAEKATKGKKESRRLRVLMMRYEGYSATETAKILGINRSSVYLQYKRYKTEGLEGLTQNKYTGNHHAMTEAQEKENSSAVQERKVFIMVFMASKGMGPLEVQQRLKGEGRAARHAFQGRGARLSFPGLRHSRSACPRRRPRGGRV